VPARRVGQTAREGTPPVRPPPRAAPHDGPVRPAPRRPSGLPGGIGWGRQPGAHPRCPGNVKRSVPGCGSKTRAGGRVPEPREWSAARCAGVRALADSASATSVSILAVCGWAPPRGRGRQPASRMAPLSRGHPAVTGPEQARAPWPPTPVEGCLSAPLRADRRNSEPCCRKRPTRHMGTMHLVTMSRELGFPWKRTHTHRSTQGECPNDGLLHYASSWPMSPPLVMLA